MVDRLIHYLVSRIEAGIPVSLEGFLAFEQVGADTPEGSSLVETWEVYFGK